MSRRKPFTLVEVVVVIVIMVLTGAVAVSAMRTDSTSRLIRRTTNEFRSLCSRVRYKAMEMGEDRMVVYDPEKRIFSMARPTQNLEEEMDYEDGFVPLDGAKWELPEEFELTTDENRPLEVFRFYPDGGASGKWNLTLAVAGKDIAMEISVAKLTGAVISREKGRGE
ncbi:MAG: hypothetical protein IKC53_07715 [Lentisphaeria bacterium]|nr:hypothetical protein [Lentisphaeria bacterium]MBR3689035.1 hypothetical protein [Lentisphaeria bacterium]